MPYFEDGYQTTVGSVMVTTQIQKSIKEAIIKDGIGYNHLDVRSDSEVAPVFILGGASSEADIPPFTHPILVLDTQHNKMLVTDMRYYVKAGTHPSDIPQNIRNLTEYNFAKARAILNLLWVTERVDEVRNKLWFAGVVYGKLISQIIGKTFSLDYRDQTIVEIVTHYFYQSLFSKESEFDEEERQRMATHTIKATKAPAELVFEVFDKIGAIKDVNDYCKVITTVASNVRLKDFNLAVLMTIIKATWYGTNAKEIIQVAVEHPPTWCAIVYSALSERTFRNSSVYHTAEIHGKRGASDEFIKNFVGMMRDNVNEPRRSIVLEALEELGDFK